MRVAMVQGTADTARDGVADYTARLVAALRAQGADVVPVVVGPGLRGVVRAARRLRALRPDVVHVQFAPSAFGFSSWPGLLPDLAGAPVVTTLHEYGWRAAPGRMWRLLEWRGLLDRDTGRWVPASAAVVTTNSGHADVVTRRHGRDPVVIPLAPNVDADTTPEPGIRRRLGVPDDARVIAFFGFVHPVKGLRYLIEALARLRAGGRDRLHLLVLGGFTSLALPEAEAAAFRAELEGVARDHGVQQHVTFTGHLPDVEVSAAMLTADVAAFPFTAGATTKSGALLSAFAHRLPTVATAADPPDRALVDGATVVVAPRVRDAEALVGALERLLDDPALRSRVADGGAVLVADRTWPRIADRHRALYAQVTQDRPRPRRPRPRPAHPSAPPGPSSCRGASAARTPR